MNGNRKLYVQESDIRGGWTAAVAWSFAFLLVLSALFLWWLYSSSIKNWLTTSGAYSIEAFPKPRLLAEPKKQLEEIRANENEELQKYSWNDSSHATAQIPIERALRITAKNGLVKTAEAPRQVQKGDRNVR